MAKEVQIILTGKDMLTGTVNKSAQSVEGLIKKALQFGLGAAAAGRLAEGIKDIGVKALESTANMQQTVTALETMTGSLDTALKTIEETKKQALKTPFQFTELIDLEKRLIAFGFNVKDVNGMLNTMGNAAAGLGIGSEGLQRMILAFGQIKAKGRVMGQEMLQLAEAGIPAYQMLADKIGITLPQMFKRMEAGAIDSNTAISAILEGMDSKFAGLMERQSLTMGGSWSNLQDAAGFALTSIGNKMDQVFNVSGLIRWGAEALKQWTGIEEQVTQTLHDIEVSRLNEKISDVKLKIQYLPTDIQVPKELKGQLADNLRKQLAELEKEYQKLTAAPVTGMQLAGLNFQLTPGEDPGIQKIKEELEQALKHNSDMEGLLGAQFNKAVEDANDLYAAIQKIIQIDPNNSLLADWALQYQDIMQGIANQKNYKPVTDAQKTLSDTLKEIAAKELLNLPEYDVLKEKVKAFETAIDSAVNSSDANTTQGKTIINAMAEMLKFYQGQLGNPSSAEPPGYISQEEAMALHLEKTTKKVYEFGDYLSQTANLLAGVQGPLQDFSESVVNAVGKIQAIQAGIGSLSRKSFVENSNGPLGALGGILGFAAGASGVIGAAVDLWGILSGSADRERKAAEAQQKAAEEWQKFLQKASVSELFGARDKITEEQKRFIALRDEMNKMTNGEFGKNDTWTLNYSNILRSGKLVGDELKHFMELWQQFSPLDMNLEKYQELTDKIKESLGISANNLASAYQSAFNAPDLSQFREKFYQASHDSLRNALIRSFEEEALFRPLSDTIMEAFSSPYMVNGINAFISPEELTQIKGVQDDLYGKSSVFYDVIGKLGFNMDELSTSTKAATESMLNVPEGIKIERYRFAASSALMLSNAPTPSSLTGQPQVSNQSASGSVVSGTRYIQIFLNSQPITDAVIVDLERNNIITNGTLTSGTPQYAT